MGDMRSRAELRANGEMDARGRWRRLAASVLSLALAFTLAPVSGAFAEEPAGDDTTPSGDNQSQVSSDDADAEEGDGGTGVEEEGAQPAAGSEDLPSLALQVRIASDGTESWDADSSAGNDSGPNNGIVRVNDTVTYEVEYVVTNNDAENLTWSITFPKGMELTQIPGYCQATGSSLVPATAGEPTIPLTADSIDQLSEQTLTCNMGNRAVATDKVFVTTKVLNLAHQGQDLPLSAATVTADGVDAPISATPPLPSVKASARLMWDISKNGTVLEEDSGYRWGPSNAPCPWDPSQTCFRTTYPVLLSAPAGGKGAMPAIGDVAFIDDLTPRAMYPGLSEAQYVAMEADLAKYGSSLVVHQTPTYASPAARRNASNTAANAVRNSGTLSQTSTARGVATELTISGADWSLRTYPTQSLTPASALPASGASYAISLSLSVFTPVATVRDFGTENSGTWVLPTFNAFTGLDVKGFDPSTDTQDSSQQPGADAAKLPAGVAGPMNWNDYRATTPNLTFNPGASKSFAGSAGAAGNMTPIDFNSGYGGWEGPPGGATMGSGGITVAPTQNITSSLQFTGSYSSLPGEVTYLACDSWDNSKLYLREADIPASGTGAVMQKVSSGGEAVWVSGYNNVPGTSERSAYASSAGQVPDIEVQYAAAPSTEAGPTTNCGDDFGPWYDSPEDVPGGDAVLRAQGVFTSVGRVRVNITLPEPTAVVMADDGAVRAIVSISMQVADAGLPTGTIIPNFFGVKTVKFEDLSMTEMLAHPSGWNPSIYVPETHSGYPRGDRLILAHAQARIDKQVRKGDSGSFSNTPPQVTGGDLVQYQLSPSLTSGAMTPGILKEVWVEDCLPASQSYDTASVTPVVVSPGSTPADAQRPACASGETYIRWVLSDHEVNTVIEPIILSVEVSPTASDGVYTNTVVVWAEDDASTLAQRRDQAQIQIANIAGIKLEKVALTPVVQVNRTGQTTNELNRWAVRLSNTLPASEQSGVTNPDVIDVLPKQGAAGTAFNGTFRFVEASVTQGGAQTRILYTKNANVSANPQDASNSASGATTWCDAPAGGTRVSGLNGCPASASEVTGLRILRPGEYLPGEVIEIQLSMVGVNNRGGDVYVNRAMAAAEGLDNTVGPIRRAEVAIESSIGDYTWWDFNRNGLQDSFRGSAEQAASGIPVRITGTDDLGNPVAIDTTTGTDGKYLFEQLRSSNGAGYTVAFTKPDGTEFTVKVAGDDRTVDSNPDPATGVSDAVALGRDTHDLTVDAGLLPLGALKIHKSLEGAGAGDFGKDDTLVFDVVCAFDDGSGEDPVEVFAQEVSLPVNGAASVTSADLGPIPAFASCKITETDAGSSDGAADEVEVEIPWNAEAQQAGTPTASLTNFYSAGTVVLAKKLDGAAKAVAWAKNKAFEFTVTCQVEEEGEDGPIRTTLYSGSVKIKGGQKKMLVNDAGDPRVLPLGTRCFGVEVDNGGADSSTIDAPSFEKGAVVTAGAPNDLQQLTISAVNTFKCTKDICGELPNTGAQRAGIVALGVIGIGLLLAGAIVLIKRRREEASTLVE